jgi:nitrite reductase/ring-hydroxylating ferredoxin subunit
LQAGLIQSLRSTPRSGSRRPFAVAPAKSATILHGHGLDDLLRATSKNLNSKSQDEYFRQKQAAAFANPAGQTAMPNDEDWVDVGHADEFAATPLKRVTAMNIELAISFRDGKFGAISNACNHAGGPLGEGRLDGDYVICPWHNWKFHRCSGVGEPGFEEDRIPSYPIKIENGRVFVNLEAGTKRQKSRMTPIRCRAKSNAHQGLCASPVLQRRPWTPQTPASRVRIICSARH